MKFCTECGQWKAYVHFKSKKGYMHPFCKACNRRKILDALAKKRKKESC